MTCAMKIHATYGRSANNGLWDMPNDFIYPCLDRPSLADLCVDKDFVRIESLRKVYLFSYG